MDPAVDQETGDPSENRSEQYQEGEWLDGKEFLKIGPQGLAPEEDQYREGWKHDHAEQEAE